jgi:hypothetical protein
MIVRQRCFDGTGPLVGEHLDLVRLDGVEDLPGDRLRADVRWAGGKVSRRQPPRSSAST